MSAAAWPGIKKETNRAVPVIGEAQQDTLYSFSLCTAQYSAGQGRCACLPASPMVLSSHLHHCSSSSFACLLLMLAGIGSPIHPCGMSPWLSTVSVGHQLPVGLPSPTIERAPSQACLLRRLHQGSIPVE